MMFVRTMLGIVNIVLIVIGVEERNMVITVSTLDMSVTLGCIEYELYCDLE